MIHTFHLGDQLKHKYPEEIGGIHWVPKNNNMEIILESENVDLIHFCSRAPAWIGVPLGAVLDIPIITSVHMRFRKSNVFVF